MANDYDRLIETVDEEGNIVKFELVDIVLVGENEYGILLPADANKDNDSEENEAVIMRLKKVDEEFIFEYIDDDNEFQQVVDAIDAMEDDDFDDDAEDEE